MLAGGVFGRMKGARGGTRDAWLKWPNVVEVWPKSINPSGKIYKTPTAVEWLP